MNKREREFIRTTANELDKLLVSLTHEEQHELLDCFAAEIEERMETLMDSEE